jgi:hypothetical protein
MNSTANINTLLADLAAQDGYMKWIDGDAPYSEELILNATDLGLVDCYDSGGMASTDVVMKLTALGRERMGLPPSIPLYRRFISFLSFRR